MGLNVYAGTCMHENQFLSFFEPSVFAIFGFGEKIVLSQTKSGSKISIAVPKLKLTTFAGTFYSISVSFLSVKPNLRGNKVWVGFGLVKIVL